MGTIYKSEKGKLEILSLYDRQMERLPMPYQDIYITTSFGKTHVVETGNLGGIPLLVFHGGNTSTAYNLIACNFLLNDFHIFAVDSIGHPGKSDEVSLSPFNYDYGKWASEVITLLGFDRMRCFGGSFGAGILAKTMCVAPQKIEKVVLTVPSGINNAAAIKSMSMLFPMIMYWITNKEKWFEKCIQPMFVTKENIDLDTFETAKCSIDNAKIKKGMPSNVSSKLMQKCMAPVLVMAGEKDRLFPAKKVLPRAKKIIPNVTTYLLKGRGHMHIMTDEEKKMVVDFLLQ